MNKRIFVILLCLMLCTGSIMQSEIHAEAAATTTAVTAAGVVKAILVLLAIAGVGITAGSIFDTGDIDESAVSKFTTWLQNQDPETYTTLMITATSIAAGRVIQTLDAIFYNNLKACVREYFGTSTSTSTEVGTTSAPIDEIAISMTNHSYYILKYNDGTKLWFGSSHAYSVIPVSFTMTGSTAEYIFFMPLRSELAAVPSSGGVGIPFTDGNTVNSLSYGNLTGRWTRYWRYYGTNFSVLNSHITGSSASTIIQTILNDYYSGTLTTTENDVIMKPFTTVGDVAATSTEATVVAPGQTISEDANGEIVIDSDTTFSLANVNIDDWLKQLADGVTSYADAMAALNLAAVNTQTQTLEEIQEVVRALNPAAAGTDYITGNYTVSLSELFPFCIPFDLYNIVNCFKADPVAPSATISIPVGYDGSSFTWQDYEISLEAFDAVAEVVRVLEYVAFVIGLMLVTRKLIEG